MTDVQQQVTRRELVLTCFDAVFRGGDLAILDDAVRHDLVEHDPHGSDGLDALRAGALARRRADPSPEFAIVRTLAEGDLVAVHSHVTESPGDLGHARFDIFRVHDNRVAEHWTAVQPVPATTASGNDMFSTLSDPPTVEPDRSAPVEVTRRIGTAFYDRTLVGTDVTGYDLYARDYRQHNPSAADGAEGGKAGLSAFYAAYPEFEVRLRRSIVDGDLILFHANMIPVAGTPGQAVVDVFRVRDGAVVEHWDVIQDVPANSTNDNGML